MPEENNSRSVFADRLRELRKISRMTQKQVAQILNLDRSTYAYYETDTTKPDYNTLVRIARMFRVSTDYMPVSYTHLDVYKRQRPRRRPTAVQTGWRRASIARLSKIFVRIIRSHVLENQRNHPLK